MTEPQATEGTAEGVDPQVSTPVDANANPNDITVTLPIGGGGSNPPADNGPTDYTFRDGGTMELQKDAKAGNADGTTRTVPWSLLFIDRKGNGLRGEYDTEADARSDFTTATDADRIGFARVVFYQ